MKLGVMGCLLTKNCPGPDRFRAGIYQTCKNSTVTNSAQTSSSKTYKASITLIPNVGKNTTKRENDKPKFLVGMDPKVVDGMLASLMQACIKKIICHHTGLLQYS